MKRFLMLAATALALMPSMASATDWTVAAKVTMVEAANMPDTLFFALDTDAGTCPARSYFSYNMHGGDTETQRLNGQAIFALLVTAKATGQVVRVAGNNYNCTVDLVYLGSVDRY